MAYLPGWFEILMSTNDTGAGGGAFDFFPPARHGQGFYWVFLALAMMSKRTKRETRRNDLGLVDAGRTA